jgi:cytoskeletal protein RodZ
MCDAMNPGWAFTLLASIYAIYILVVFWIMKKGMGWRAQAAEKKKKRKEEARAAAEGAENQSNLDRQSSNETEVEDHKITGEK